MSYFQTNKTKVIKEALTRLSKCFFMKKCNMRLIIRVRNGEW